MDASYDIILCSIPFSNLDHIYSAPAVLKGVLKSQGYSCKTLELGLSLLEGCDNNFNQFDKIQQYFITTGLSLTNKEQKIIDLWLESTVDLLLSYNSAYIGISVLSIHQQLAAYKITEKLHERGCKSKIIIGGRGCKVKLYSIFTDHLQLTSWEKMIGFGEFLNKRQLVDHVVIGDGEDAIVSILNDNAPAITVTDSDTFAYPEPDYEDYEFNKYLFPSEVAFPITGSKGCVRNCDFCDIQYQFGRFKLRSGKDIANEMLQIKKKYGYSKFRFTDSLVNGGLKSLREFCEVIADYNHNNPNDRIKWDGQYICRPEQQMQGDLYALMKASGAEGLTIGAESGSNHVLTAMNKKSTANALYHELEQFRKHGLTCVLLSFVGHWEETWEDFVEHCQMLVRITPYVRSGTISAITLGSTGMVLDGTPVRERVTNNEIILCNKNEEYIWFNPKNPTTFKERVIRRLIVTEIADWLHLPTTYEATFFGEISGIIQDNQSNIEEFYDKMKLQYQNIGNVDRAIDTYNNIPKFLRSLENNEINIELDIDVNISRSIPTVVIELDGENFYKEKLTQGNYRIRLNKKIINDKFSIRMLMYGKQVGDTVIDQSGNIISDTSVIIKRFIINDCDILDDPDFYHGHLKYYIDGKPEVEARTGFWQDAELVLDAKVPFIQWYSNVSTKNRSVEGTEMFLHEKKELDSSEKLRLQELTKSMNK